MKQIILRTITGLIILAIGVGALLGALNLIPFWGWFGVWWPLLIIIGGVLVLVGDLRKNYMSALVLLIIGGFLLLKNLGSLEFNTFLIIVSVIIIMIGLSVLINSENRMKAKTESKNTDDISTVLGGGEFRNKSQDYQGGKVTAVLGGVSLDLRDAKIKGEARLEVLGIMGGIEIRVPRDWQVISKIAPIVGGVENKAESSPDSKSPVLTVVGTVALGGIEIKT